jgi:hypothetical protein
MVCSVYAQNYANWVFENIESAPSKKAELPRPINGRTEAEAFTDMYGIAIEPTRDVGGGSHIGSIDKGDWIAFDVLIETSGSYTVDFRLASETTAGSILLQIDGATILTQSIPVTGNGRNWQTVSNTITLPSGGHALRLYFETDGFKLNWMEFISLEKHQSTDYYLDSRNGSDSNPGTDVDRPWGSLSRLADIYLYPGDTVHFRSGSQFSGGVQVNGNGTSRNPITLTTYGTGNAPRFTNPDIYDLYGNCIRIRGDYFVIENLHFRNTGRAPTDRFLDVWEVGALYITFGSDHTIIRNNQFVNCVKSIHSYGEDTVITHNRIQGAKGQFLGGGNKWGTLGIHLGIGNQEISYNTITDCFVSGGHWGGDGGAIEIDDARNHHDNIYIHHNYSRDNIGFVEITGKDVGRVVSNSIVLAYNYSDDYQSFCLWFARGVNNVIENNTIIRTKQLSALKARTVFHALTPHTIRNNLIVVDDLTAVYTGTFPTPDHIRSHNLYWDIEDDNPDIGLSPGPDDMVADPQFIDFGGRDCHLQASSPAIDAALEVGYRLDLDDKEVPQGSAPDIGAYEFAPGY